MTSFKDVAERIKNGYKFNICFRRGSGFIKIRGHKGSEDGYIVSFYNRIYKNYESISLHTLYLIMTGKIEFDIDIIERIIK